MLTALNTSILLSLFTAVLTVFFSLLVITVTNPIYSVLALICLFFVVAFLILLLGAEFIGFIYILIYVGAVLILFLWVVMTMPIKKNVYSTFKLPFLLIFFFSACLLIYLAFLAESTTLVVRITPDSRLFSAFVIYLREHVQFKFTLRAPQQAAFYQTLFANSPLDLTGYEFVAPLPKGNFIYDIFVIVAAHSIVHMYPIDMTSTFVFELREIYLNLHGSTGSLGNFYKTCEFFVELAKVCENPLPLPTRNLSYLQSHPNILFLPKESMLFRKISFIYPPFFNLDLYQLMHPTLLRNFVLNLHKNDSTLFTEPNWLRVLEHSEFSSLQLLGFRLYSAYGSLLIVIGLILLAALVGTVTLIKFYRLNLKDKISLVEQNADEKEKNKPSSGDS